MEQSNLIKVKIQDVEIDKKGDLIESRKEFCRYFDDEAEVTISVIAYNRLDVTRTCVESILRNTQGINYKLILVYNDNEGQEAILDYFKEVDYKNKLILHISQNKGVGFANKQILKYMEGKYHVSLANDVIVTPNWLNNLIACAESDDTIGMVNPVSTNVSNYQCVNLPFTNYEELCEVGRNYNVSNPAAWEERLRLMTLGTLFTRPCLETLGTKSDIGFFHDFSDDDISFRVRRAGYKCILARDTWVHHDHDQSTRDWKKAKESIDLGRKVFLEKYKGIDAWDDVMNFCPEYTDTIKGYAKKHASVLGVDVKCGSPILEIKNALRRLGVMDVETAAFTQEAKYYEDLLTVCGENVVCGESEAVLETYLGRGFDFIVVGNEINTYKDPMRLLRNLSLLLEDGGKLFVSLKNARDLRAFAYLTGNFSVYDAKNVWNIPVEQFIGTVNSFGVKARFLTAIPMDMNMFDKNFLESLRSKVEQFGGNNVSEIWGRLTADRYAFEITR